MECSKQTSILNVFLKKLKVNYLPQLCQHPGSSCPLTAAACVDIAGLSARTATNMINIKSTHFVAFETQENFINCDEKGKIFIGINYLVLLFQFLLGKCVFLFSFHTQIPRCL